MAASGTGLPSLTSGTITPLVDASAYGAAERASAEAMQTAVQGVGRFQDRILRPMAEQEARDSAATDVIEGRLDNQRGVITAEGQLYNQTLRAGAAAQAAREDTTYLEGLAAEAPFDPEAFGARAAAYRTEMLERRPAWLAMDWSATFDSRRDQLAGNLKVAQIHQQTREAPTALVGRRDDLVRRLTRQVEEDASFDPTAPSVAPLLAELDSIQGEVEANPFLTVNAEEAARQSATIMDGLQASAFAGLVRRTYRDQGPDAALALMQTSLPQVGEGGATLPTYVSPGAGAAPQGLMRPGNIDLAARPVVDNGDGTISTVRSISIEEDGQHILIPTVTDDGRVVSDEDAIATYQQTGRHLGIFDSEAAAGNYATVLSDDQAVGRNGAPVVSGRARQQAYEAAVAAYGQESTIAQQRQNIASAQRSQAATLANNMLEAMRYGGPVDHNQLRSLAEVSGDPSLVAKVRWAIEVGVQPPPYPGSDSGSGGRGRFDGDASTAGGFDAWVEFVIDAEGGDVLIENDNGRGPSRWGINQTANPDLDVRNMTGEAGRQIAIRRYRQQYWDSIGADQLPPGLAFVASDAAVTSGVPTVRRWLEQAGGDVGVFLSIQERHYRALAQRDPAKYGDDLRGWLNRMERARARAARIEAFALNQDGFANDPISFATGNSNRPALANVVALPIDAVGSAQWFNAVRSRYATGETLAERYNVPRRMFTSGEVQTYQARFRDDPTAIIPFAQALTSAIGGRKAREALVELGDGESAATLIHIADLASTGGDRRFAEQAALGLRTQAVGIRLDKEKRDEIVEGVNAYRSSFGEQPLFMQAIFNAATSAALADEQAGQLRNADYYVQAAIGRTTWQGRPYGGAAKVNNVTVVVPRWLNPEYADEALEAYALGRFQTNSGPVYGNDQPIPVRDIARMRMVPQSNGAYRLVDRNNRVAYGRDGRPFEMDLERWRPYLRQNLGPQAVRPD